MTTAWTTSEIEISQTARGLRARIIINAATYQHGGENNWIFKWRCGQRIVSATRARTVTWEETIFHSEASSNFPSRSPETDRFSFQPALISDWIRSLMQRHGCDRYYRNVGLRGTVSKKTGYSNFSPEAINSVNPSFRDVHPLPLIPAFIPAREFSARCSNRRVNCVA